MTHIIKIQKPYADAVLDGRKNFEVRLNDRGYNAGDKVLFTVMDGDFSNLSHPLNKKGYDITYVHSGLGLEQGYVVFGIKERGDNHERNI